MELITMSAERDDTLTIDPDPSVSTIACAASLLSKNGATALKCNAVERYLADVCIDERGWVPPALLTRMDTRPNRSTAASTSVLSSSRTTTSVGTPSPRRHVCS